MEKKLCVMRGADFRFHPIVLYTCRWGGPVEKRKKEAQVEKLHPK